MNLADGCGRCRLPPEGKNDFPFEMVDFQNAITTIANVTLEEHLGRLARSRSFFLNAFYHITLDDWRRLRNPEDVEYKVTPEWGVFHLVEHEAGHAFQSSSIKRRAHGFLR